MAETIIIRTTNANDITIKEVEEIATAVRGLNHNCDVQVEAHERFGYGITWFEVLRISLLGGAFGIGKVFTEEVAKKIADVIVVWARERFTGRKSASKRPVYMAIYGPDGIVKSLVVKNATDPPEDHTKADQGRERQR